MIPKKRIRLSAMQRVEVWRRWNAGESLHAIGRALGKNNVVIHLLLKRHGGIAPPIRRRSPSSVTLAEREDISRGIASQNDIQSPKSRVANQFLTKPPSVSEEPVVPSHEKRLMP